MSFEGSLWRRPASYIVSKSYEISRAIMGKGDLQWISKKTAVPVMYNLVCLQIFKDIRVDSGFHYLLYWWLEAMMLTCNSIVWFKTPFREQVVLSTIFQLPGRDIVGNLKKWSQNWSKFKSAYVKYSWRVPSRTEDLFVTRYLEALRTCLILNVI